MHMQLEKGRDNFRMSLIMISGEKVFKLSSRVVDGL